MTLGFDSRDQEREAFLAAAGWGEAICFPATQDASTRRYFSLTRLDGAKALLMDAPPRAEDPPCPPNADEAMRRALGWNASARLAACRVDAFVAIAAHLASLDLSPPKILARDSDQGFAIVEHLGDDLFAARLARRPGEEVALYTAAGALLAHLHGQPRVDIVADGEDAWPILALDRLAIEVNVDLFSEWMPRFAPDMARDDATLARFEAARSELIAELEAYPTALTLRDYHAENLLWLADRSGHARIGLLDFQDAVWGPRVWDFSMLLHDARRDVSPAAHAAAIRAYLERSGMAEEAFDEQLAVAGALNTLRILGVFARLVARDGKPRYRTFMPREWGHLDRLLAAPAAGAIAAVINDMLPGWRRLAA